MKRYIIPGWIPSPTFPPPPLDPEDAGVLHNYYVFHALKQQYELGVDPSLSAYSAYYTQVAAGLESGGTLPLGSVGVVATIFNALIGNESAQDFLPVINDLQSIHNGVLNNPVFDQTLLRAITSVALASAQFWAEVREETGGGAQMAMAIPKWLKVVAGDVGGALGGAGSGIAIGTAVPGIGNAVGGVVGGVVGGACGSIAAA